MEKKLLLLLSFLIVSSGQILAQGNPPPPCPDPPPSGAANCQSTCVYCDFDGYMGINNTPPSGGNSGCPGIALHNDEWYGFTAGSTSLTITLILSGCQNGDGLQAAFWSNCGDANALVCNSGCGGCGNNPVVLTYDNFTIGETYYLMIDGWVADVCNFEIEITDGTITPPPPDAASQPQGPTMVCPGAVVEYTIPDVFGAGNYIWTAPPGSSINGMGSTVNINAPGGTTVTITFGASGGNVCVSPDNACNPPGAAACLPVTNQPIPITVLDPILICEKDAPFTWDQEPYPILSLPGVFTLTSTPYDSWLGCDSTVRQTITIKAIPPQNIGTRYICAGECFELGTEQFCDAGIYSVNFESFQGCDSVINFTLVVLDPVAVIQPPANPIDCNSSGVLLTSTGSTPPGQGSYGWHNSNWSFLAGTPSYNATLTGTYYLVVTTQAGGVQCRDTAMVTVVGNTTPPGATATGGNINCISNQVQLTGNSPTGGVTYSWTGPGINPGNQFQQNPTVNQPGPYVLTVQNPVNGCTSTASVTVLGDITPPAANAIGGTITCLQTSVTIDGTTNVPNATWNWSGPGINAGNQNLEDPNVNVGGTYNVTVTNVDNGCTNTISAVVDVNNSNPAANAGPDQTLTCTDPDAVLQGSGDAGGQPFTFAWVGPNGFMSDIAQPTVNEGGTYILTILNTQNGCFRNDTVNVAVNQALPNANAGADSTITCAEPSVTLIGSGSSSGPNFTATWSGPGINAGNSNLYNPVVDQQGTYDLVITNITNGCTATDQVVVDINTNLPTVDAGNDLIITCTDPNGVDLSGNGTPANITYLWSGPGIGANNQNQQNPTVTQPGTYVLVVTDPINGCTATDQTEVTQDADVPDADAGPDRVLTCSVLSVDIDGSGSTSGPGIIYEWTGPGINAGNANDQSPGGLNAPGTYNLVVTNTNNNCVNTDVVVIQIDTITPNANAGNPLILNCFNNAIDTLRSAGSSAGANFSLLWSGPGITPANQNSPNPVINNEPGLYTLVVTNNTNNCTATDQVNVSADLADPVADAGPSPTIDCVVLSTTIGGNSSVGPNFSYQWTGPGINAGNGNLATPTVDAPGNYNIVVTNTINGCTASSDVVVNSDAIYPTALAGNDGLLTCAVQTVVIDGSASSSGPNFQIQWTGPDINAGNEDQPAPVVSIPGTYILAVTNTTNSCVTRDTVVVDQNIAIPDADAGLDAILNCQTTSTTLSGSLSSSGPGIVYLWSGPGINPSNENDQNPPVDQPGNYTILVTDNANGCTNTDQVLVTQDIAVPTANAGADQLLTCTFPSVTIDGSGSSSGAEITYVWQGPGINSNNFNLQSPTVNVTGTYNVTVTNTVNFCTATDVVFVAVDQTQPITTAGPVQTLTCAATTVQMDASQSASGPEITYAWGGPGVIAGGNTPTPTVNLPGIYTITVTNTDNGCSNVASTNVDQDVALPVVNAGSDMQITCANASVGVTLLSAGSDTGPNFEYLWTGAGITPANETNPNPTVLVPGTYTLQITNTINGCTRTDQVLVSADQNLPTALAGQDQTLNCSITAVILDGSGSTTPSGTLSYSWTGPGINAGNVNSPNPSVSVSGSYVLTVENTLTGCSASDQVEVLLDDQPPVSSASSDVITCAEPLSTLVANSSAPGSSFLWEGPGVTPASSQNQSLQVDAAGLYSVTVTGPNGCTSVATTLVELDADVPQGFVESAVLNCLNNGSSTISGQVISPAGSTVTWTGPGITTPLTTESINVNQAGVYTFTIFAPNGCVRPLTATVTADFQQPTVLATATAQINCTTSEVTINATGTSTGPNFNFQWSTVDGQFVSGMNTLTPRVNRAGQYQLVVTNTLNGCSNSVSVPVTIDPEVPTGFDVTVRNIRCFGDTNGSIGVNGVIGGTPPFMFTLTSSTGSANNQYTGLSAGQYVLSLEDANGCFLDTTITIGEPGMLQVELGPNIEVSLGETATVSAQIQSTIGVTSVEWNYAPGCDSLSTDFCETFEYLPYDTYRHIITVTDVNGCVARDEVLVIVQKRREIYVPNIFNPESDLNFNVGVFVGIDVAKIKKFAIFDRWGEQMFYLDEYIPANGDSAQAWDGRYRGDKSHVGVYVWYCEVEFIDGEKKLFTGDVTLIR